MTDMIEFLQSKYTLVEKNERLFKLQTNRDELIDIIHFITTNTNFITLSQIACTDWIEERIFAVNYLLTTDQRDKNLMVEVLIDRENPVLQSLLSLFPQAEVMERDLHEMFGIAFPGNETLYDFALEGWNDIPPMRREFDTLAYVNEHYDFRGGRDDNKDVKAEMKRRRAEAKKLKEAQAKKEGGEEDGN
ncbi:MAG: NADH-quinone oxidoreductase subunit C [Campylobacterota bacterium]|nr:NADH-quinone oxidoreductase subunit C [Campylobacterota bacterium]